MKTVFTIIAIILFFLVVFILSTTVFSSIPYVFEYVHIPLLVIMAFAITRHTRIALYGAVSLGYMMDLFSALPFGVFVSTYVIATLMLLFFQNRFFKNFALHAVVLNTGFAMLIYSLVFFAFVRFSNNDLLADQFFQIAFIQWCVHVCIMIVLFFLLKRFAMRTYSFST